MKNLFFSLLFLLGSSLAGKSQVMINEIQAFNQDFITDPDYGEFADWIEIYNSGSGQADISGWSLNDSLGKNINWVFPPRTIIQPESYLLIWLDDKGVGLHADFRLKSKGESVFLFNQDAQVIDSITYPSLETNISYGRIVNNLDQWAYFYNPTPGSKNETGFLSDLLPEIIFSHEEGIHDQSFQLSLSTSNPSLRIKYTTDGSSPTLQSLNYSGPITISRPTIIRATAYIDSILPNYSQSRFFMVNEPQAGLPIISLSTNPANLWDNSVGIYITGTNGIKGNGPESDPPRNWNRDWERPAEMTFIDENGEIQIKQRVGIKIFGGWSRSNGQKSLSVFARKKYGKSSFDYPLFPDKNIQQYESFILRNSGNDWSGNGGTHMRDAVLQAIAAGKMNVDYQGYYPAEVYLNGEYWGVHNIREKLNEHYVAGNHNENPDAVDLLEGFGHANEGSEQDYFAMINWLQNTNLSSQSNYEQAADLIDIDHFIDYQIIQIYIDNRDWPGNNIKFWKPWRQGGKWRWILFDTDFGFGIWGQSPADNTIQFARASNGPGWPNPPWSTLIFRKLLENQGFRNAFVKRFNYHLNTTFQPARVIGIIDSIQNKILPAMTTRHLSRWNGISSGQWLNRVESMRTYARSRPQYVKQHLRSEFGLQNPISNFILKPDSSEGYLMIDREKVNQNIEISAFEALPVELTAFPVPDKRFSHWQVLSGSEVTLITPGAEWKYWDLVNDPIGNWKDSSFDDSGWGAGNAQLGYGDGDEATILSFGPDPDNKIPSIYFRKKFSINLKENYSDFNIELLRDDGAIVYLNGVEIIRSNMPDSPIDRNTFALESIFDDGENEWHQFEIDENLFFEGENTIAVEIHQIGPGSSDLSFDFSLTAVENQAAGSQFYDQTISLPIQTGGNISAIFADARPVITEIFYLTEESSEAEFIEICNPSSVSFNLGNYSLEGINYTFPAGINLPSESCLIIARNPGLYQNQGFQVFQWESDSLSITGESLFLTDDSGEIIDSLTFSNRLPWPEIERGFSIQLRNMTLDNGKGKNWKASRMKGGSPGYFEANSLIQGIFINEVLTDNEKNLLSIHGESSDWIELYNSNDFAVNLGGLYFSDRQNDPFKWQIPQGSPIQTTIPAKGFLLFRADGNIELGPRNIGIKLSKDGENIMISDEEGLLIDSLRIPALKPDESFGRIPDGDLETTIFPVYSTTPRISNTSANTPPVIISQPAVEISPNSNYSYQIQVDDEIRENIRLTPECMPSWLTFTDNENGTGSISGLIHPDLVGFHLISFQASDGIINSSARQAFVLEVLDLTSIQAQSQPSGFFYPNPSLGIFNYTQKANMGDIFRFEIFDLQGKQIQSFEFINNSDLFDSRINISSFPKGVYLARVWKNDQYEETYKLVRE